MKTKVLIVCSVLFLSLFSCNTLSQLVAFKNCNYELVNLSNTAVAGVSLAGLQNVNNLNAASLLKVTTAIMSGNLPLSATVNVKATNPNAKMAQVEKLEWAIDLNNTNILTGNVNQRISVPANGGQTVIPFNFQMDVMKLVKKGEKNDNIINFVNNVLRTGEGSSTVTIRIKPTVSVGGKNISTGYITLKKSIS
jgi:LEA14-like dessication related protein